MSERTDTFYQLSNVNVSINARASQVSVLQHIDLRIAAHERVAILGANGAGKSTLLRVLHGLLPATSGEVVIPEPKTQAMIFQRPLHLKRSAIDNLIFALHERGLERAVAQRRAREALHACGITALADRYARSLSGGEQQLLALARAWALSPRALIADEPTSSLAPATVHAVEEVLFAMASRADTLVFSTHNRGQAKRLSTRVLFMHEGRIVEDQPTDRFFELPLSPEAEAYLAVERV